MEIQVWRQAIVGDNSLMRWKDRHKALEKRVGERRIVKKFLLFPTKLDSEWRWFENVLIIQKVTQVDIGGSIEWGSFSYEWRNECWLDSPCSCLKVYKDYLK